MKPRKTLRMLILRKPVDPQRALASLILRHGSQQAAAEAIGISASYFSELVLGRKTYSDRLLAALGLERIIVRKAAK